MRARTLAGLGAAGAAGLAFYGGQVPTAQIFGPTICRGAPGRKLISLTYDDGPSEWTEPILDHFAEHGGRATFFVLGNAIDGDDRRETLLRTVAEGHEIGNHTFTHPGDLSTLDDAVIRREIDRAQAAIRETAGVEPVHWRTPFLRTSERLLSVVNEYCSL